MLVIQGRELVAYLLLASLKNQISEEMGEKVNYEIGGWGSLSIFRKSQGIPLNT